MIGPDNLKKFSWFLFGSIVCLLAIILSSRKYFGSIFIVIASFALAWTVYLIYACEKLTVYLTSVIVAFVGMFSMLSAVMAYLAAAKFFGRGAIAAFLIGFVPLGVVWLAYLILVTGKSSFHPFEYDGIKVQTRPENKLKTSKAYSPLLVAGATTLAASIFTESVGSLASGLIAMVGLMVFSVALLFHARHIIRGLRVLRIQEKTMPVPYTFMRIDEIRQARSRWWLSRLIKWIASARGSSGA